MYFTTLLHPPLPINCIYFHILSYISFPCPIPTIHYPIILHLKLPFPIPPYHTRHCSILLYMHFSQHYPFATIPNPSLFYPIISSLLYPTLSNPSHYTLSNCLSYPTFHYHRHNYPLHSVLYFIFLNKHTSQLALNLGHRQPLSESTFKCRFNGGPMVTRFYMFTRLSLY